MSEQTLFADSPDAEVRLRLPVGFVVAEAFECVVVPRVRLSTDDETGPAADAVRSATAGQTDGILAVDVPDSQPSGADASPVLVWVEMPAGSSLTVETVSADLKTTGRFGRLRFDSPFGDLRAAYVRELEAQTVTGAVTVSRAERTRVRTVSGDIVTRRYDGSSGRLLSTSGDVEVTTTEDAAGSLTAHTVSGDVYLRCGPRVRVDARSVSGDVLPW